MGATMADASPRPAAQYIVQGSAKVRAALADCSSSTSSAGRSADPFRRNVQSHVETYKNSAEDRS